MEFTTSMTSIKSLFARIAVAGMLAVPAGVAGASAITAHADDPTYCTSHGGTDGPATATFHSLHDSANGVNDALGQPLGPDQPGSTLHNKVEPFTCNPPMVPTVP
jgi:hypothetical protein